MIIEMRTYTLKPGSVAEAGQRAGEFVLDMQNELRLPAPFSPALEPRQAGPLFGLRQYTLTLGAIP